MSKMRTAHPKDDRCESRSSRKAARPFILWQEVMTSYASPAIMASIGAWMTKDSDLQTAALTTIGGTSALIAWLLGSWLRKRGAGKRWIIRTNRLVLVLLFAVFGVGTGLLGAMLTTGLLEYIPSFDHRAWFDRVWFDFPISATIASTIMIWRWRGTLAKNK